MCYRQLAPREKYHIEFNFGKMSLRQIAIELNRAVSTISREVKRCLSFGFTTYLADYKERINQVRERGLLQTQRQSVANGEIFTQTKIKSRADFRSSVVKKRDKNQTSSDLQLDLS